MCGSRGEKWSPSSEASPFEVIIRATDSKGRDDNEQFDITINQTPVDPTPVFNPIENLTIDEQESIALTLSATDADTPIDQLRYEAIKIPINATLDPVTGEFQWTSNEYSGGLFFNVDVKVTDTDGLSDQKRFRITVNEANRPPSLSELDNATLKSGESLSTQAIASDPDRPNDTLTFSLTESPQGATISDAGQISWTPTQDQTASDQPFRFTVRVGDANGGFATESFDITVDNTSPTLNFIENQENRRTGTA